MKREHVMSSLDSVKRRRVFGQCIKSSLIRHNWRCILILILILMNSGESDMAREVDPYFSFFLR